MQPKYKPSIDTAAPLQSSVDAVTGLSIIVLDKDGNVTSWPPGAERARGYTADEIIGQNFSVFFTEEDRRLGKPASLLDDARTHDRAELTGWRVRKNGDRFWASVVIDVMRGKDNAPIGFAELEGDTSFQHRSQERFRQVVESAPNAMVMIDASGNIEMVNTQAELVFGYDRHELLGHPVEILLPLRFRHHHPNLRTAFFGTPQTRSMGEGRDLYALRKDGSEFPVEIGLNPIETDEGTMVLSAIVDISARRRSEERFRLVVESAPNAMVMINAGGRIEMVNTQTERVFGYGREELLGQPVEMLVPPRFRGQHPGLRTAFFAAPQSRSMGVGRDLYALKKDGSEFPVEIGLNPIETDEGTMVLSAIVDISDRKQKEARILSALKEKDLMLGEIHHRVKNNLQVVCSLLDLQSPGVQDRASLNLLKECQNRVRSMAMIHQMLYESKDFVQVDFRSFLDNLVPSLVAAYGSDPDRIALSIDAVEVRLPINMAIPCGLVVNELISNALKHAFPGNRAGEIAIYLASDPADLVVLSVSDNGVGLPEDCDIELATTLGLQLVTLFADQLGAEMAIHRSNPTRFELRFPISRSR
jgi:PAS domain S-box-containing protein